ncbi:hypothetical protein AB1Y20_021462 [Prymnesium parvum]|uniref:Transmembrane protein n=1 Tax=Prymnesium parvum TaxID=97485 RepID=A0AB34JJV5_PRYPA
MLDAEKRALEHRLTQQLMSVRQKEIDYMLTCYQSVGVQAALVAGFAIGTMTNIVNPDDVEGGLYFVYFFFSIASIVCCMMAVLIGLYVGNWAPRLALLGPRGSVARAHALMQREVQSINKCFVAGIVFFACQTVLAVWILYRATAHWAIFSSILTIITLIMCVYCWHYLRKMRARFFAEAPEAFNVDAGGVDIEGGSLGAEHSASRPPFKPAALPLRGAAAGPGSGHENFKASAASAEAPDVAAGGGGRSRQDKGNASMPLLDNPLAAATDHPDVSYNHTFKPVQRRSVTPPLAVAPPPFSQHFSSTQSNPPAPCLLVAIPLPLR